MDAANARRDAIYKAMAAGMRADMTILQAQQWAGDAGYSRMEAETVLGMLQDEQRKRDRNPLGAHKPGRDGKTPPPAAGNKSLV